MAGLALESLLFKRIITRSYENLTDPNRHPIVSFKVTHPVDEGQNKKFELEESQERTFLTFSDHDTYRKAFPLQRRRLSQAKICPITREAF